MLANGAVLVALRVESQVVRNADFSNSLLIRTNGMSGTPRRSMCLLFSTLYSQMSK